MTPLFSLFLLPICSEMFRKSIQKFFNAFREIYFKLKLCHECFRQITTTEVTPLEVTTVGRSLLTGAAVHTGGFQWSQNWSHTTHNAMRADQT